ncbi:MAG: enoyl-CoA hydratase/isomerase family protein [Gammaproteobacteria bacterium]|nr:enoyl-CoA hydratase/isomerase family protein [Gammaproteobacteria bacterium]
MNIEVLHFDQDIHVKLLHWQRRGALNTQILTELLAVFAADQEKNIILSGGQGYFCAGLDLKEMQTMLVSEKRALNALYGQVLRLWMARKGHKLVFMDGPVIGGGLGFVLTADYVVATRQAWFCLPELSKGLGPVQIHHLVTSRLGASSAQAWFSGMRIDVPLAMALGVVQELTEMTVMESWIKARYTSVIAANQFIKDMEKRKGLSIEDLAELFV